MSQYNELFAALAKAQAEMQTAGTNSSNPFFKSKYADFTEIVRASRPALAANGLCVIQRIITATDGMTLCTTLGHSSGQYIDSEMRISPAKSDVQSLGSYISYLKRYQYAAICGVTISDEDNDGETDMQEIRTQERSIETQRIKPDIERITSEQHEQLQMELKDHPKIAEDLIRSMSKIYINKDPNHLGFTKLSELPKSDFYTILNFIKKNKDAIR